MAVTMCVRMGMLVVVVTMKPIEEGQPVVMVMSVAVEVFHVMVVVVVLQDDIEVARLNS